MRLTSSIYARFFVPFAAVLVAAMFTAAGIASYLLTNALQERLDDRLGRAAAVFAEGLIPLTPDLLDRAAPLLQADIVLLDSNGTPALSTLPSGEEPMADEVAGLVLPDLAEEPLRFDFRDYRVVAQRVTRDPRYSILVMIAPTADLRRASRQAAIGLGIAAAAATLVLGIATYYLVLGIVGPLTRLSRMAGRIAEGERDINEPVQRSDELGALTGALNEMAKRLGSYEAELATKARLTALGEMAARIAHEIRNPLTAIKLKLELLEESAAAEHRDEVRALLLEIERLNFIVTGTLSIARPRAIDRRLTDFNATIEAVVRLVEAQLAHQKVAIETRFANLPLVPIDEARVKQIVFNLIDNAVKAMPEGGRLRITTSNQPEKQRVRLVVEDSGTGLSAQQIATLFKPETAPDTFKLGIGLSLCRELVELHGGCIEAGHSDDLGGAKFSIELAHA